MPSDMPGDRMRPSLGERTLDSITDAQRVVDRATIEVDHLKQHLHDAVEAAQRPETYIAVLRQATRAAPLTMLVAALVTGMMIARARR